MSEEKRARVAELEAELGRLRAELGWDSATEAEKAAVGIALPADAVAKQHGRSLEVERLAQIGSDPPNIRPEDFPEYVKAGADKIVRLVKQIGIVAEQ